MIDFEKLAEPFPPSRIHWRVGKTFDDGTGIVLAYLDARDVMGRLDEVCGPDGWMDDYEETHSGRVICSLSIRTEIMCITHEEDKRGFWVTKSDGAGSTSFEGEKGAISDAFKRAAVKWGIGRYLYELKAPRIELNQGKWIPNNFNGAQYLTAFSSKQMKTKVWNALKAAAAEDDDLKAKETWRELNNDQQLEVWQDLSSGVRSTIKKLLEVNEDG